MADEVDPGPEVQEGPSGGGLRAPTGWTLVALVAAVCFLAGALGWALGQERPPGADSADVGFLYDMRTHHDGAIELSSIELAEGDEEGIKVFAEEILLFQAYEAGLMDRMLLEWGYRLAPRPETAMRWMGHEVTPPEAMPGMATEEEIDSLHAAEEDVDARFLELIIEHHVAGAAMAEAAVEQVDDADVRRLAARMASNQRAEIGELRAAAVRAGIDLDG